MLRQVLNAKGRAPTANLCQVFRQMHLGGGDGVRGVEGTSQLLNPLLWQQSQASTVTTFKSGTGEANQLSQLLQGRPGALEMPMHSIIRPSIGIPPDMLRRSEYRVPVTPRITPVEIPTVNSNLTKEIRDSPDNPNIIEKQAARLIVIRRTKMNKHKLRKLRKKMKYVWAKIRLRRAIKREKEYLNSKMELINAAKQFDAKEYVAGIIKKAKEEPIPYKWTDPLMPEWFKEQEMKKEAWQKRYQKMINLYLNKGITIDFTEKKKTKP